MSGHVPMAPEQRRSIPSNSEDEPVIPAETDRIDWAAVSGVPSVACPFARARGPPEHSHVPPHVAADDGVSFRGAIDHRYTASQATKAEEHTAASATAAAVAVAGAAGAGRGSAAGTLHAAQFLRIWPRALGAPRACDCRTRPLAHGE